MIHIHSNYLLEPRTTIKDNPPLTSPASLLLSHIYPHIYSQTSFTTDLSSHSYPAPLPPPFNLTYLPHISTSHISTTHSIIIFYRHISTIYLLTLLPSLFYLPLHNTEQSPTTPFFSPVFTQPAFATEEPITILEPNNILNITLLLSDSLIFHHLLDSSRVCRRIISVINEVEV